MEHDYGTVEFKGKTYALQCAAYLGKSRTLHQAVYKAEAVDDDGNRYEVTWLTTEEWDLALERIQVESNINNAQCEGDASKEDKARFAALDAMDLPDVYDTSNACYWDYPYDVMLIEANN